MAGDSEVTALNGSARELGEITYANGYNGMIEFFRAQAWRRQVAISSESVAAISGLPMAYVAKLLQPRPTKRVGAISLGPLLGILGLKLIVAEDPDAIARFGSKLEKRREEFVHTATVQFAFSRQHLKKIQRKGGLNSRKYMSSRQARVLARKAALARWRNGAANISGQAAP